MEESIISGSAWMVARCCQAQAECSERDQSCRLDHNPNMVVLIFDSCDIPDDLRHTKINVCG
jgi:hypothetical protein